MIRPTAGSERYRTGARQADRTQSRQSRAAPPPRPRRVAKRNMSRSTAVSVHLSQHVALPDPSGWGERRSRGTALRCRYRVGQRSTEIRVHHLRVADVRRTVQSPGGLEFIVETWRPLDTFWQSPVVELLGRVGATSPSYRVMVRRSSAGTRSRIVHRECLRTYEEALQRVEQLVEDIQKGLPPG
jgi:hypothetical protein